MEKFIREVTRVLGVELSSVGVSAELAVQVHSDITELEQVFNHTTIRSFPPEIWAKFLIQAHYYQIPVNDLAMELLSNLLDKPHLATKSLYVSKITKAKAKDKSQRPLLTVVK